MNDNCPNGDRDSVAPIVEDIRGNQIGHLYRCTGCGHIWAANRDLDTYEQEAA